MITFEEYRLSKAFQKRLHDCSQAIVVLMQPKPRENSVCARFSGLLASNVPLLKVLSVITFCPKCNKGPKCNNF